MHDETVAYLDLTGCSKPYDFFDRIIKACDLGDCGHSWDAVFDFMRTETPVVTLYITGEGAIDPSLRSYIPKLHEILDILDRECRELFGTPFTTVVLS